MMKWKVCSPYCSHKEFEIMGCFMHSFLSTTRGGDQGGQEGSGPSNFFEQQKQVRFQQTHHQSLRQLFLTVGPGTHPPSAAHFTVSLILCSSGSNTQGKPCDLKGTISARNALQGSRRRRRTEDNSVSPTSGHWVALQANQ